ncbi:MAG: RagB/SusD family nutrient uptake outer membrane protein [Marinilabilia sp.]
MNTKIFKGMIVAGVFGLMLAFTTSCYDLNTEPLSETEVTSASVFDDPASYKQFLAKLYAGLAVSGQDGPAGEPDISGIDEGFSQFLRGYWMAQELSTDEALVSWNDQTIKDFHDQDWGSTDVFITALYYRVFYQIPLANEFLRETTDSKLDSRGVESGLRDDIQTFRAEARFLRALSYWHGIDLFANIPFVTEEDPVGNFLPEQKSRSFVFDFIEEELLAIESELPEPGSNEYGRADKAAAWTLLAKLYLNAEVYTGEERYTDCITYCERIINAGYELSDDYERLFLADNHTQDNEIIFPIAFDGEHTKSYGGMTYIIAAALNGEWGDLEEMFGTTQGWGGNRTTKALVEKFPEDGEDSRAMFFTEGHSLEIDEVGDFFQGYGVTKFKNLTSDGEPGSNEQFMDTDFPMFRLADVYLMYAEAVLRGGEGGSVGDAVTYVNALRERAYGDESGNISQSDLDLDFIIDERARELYWEAHRRTDLVRFDSFSQSDYVWPWKGGIKEGKSTDPKYDVFPIPADDLGANPKLEQNEGY